MGDPRDVLALVGQVIDNVRFDAFIDEGGFGYVYRAWHLGLDVPVAVKCLKISGDTKYGSFAARFRDETKIAYKLSQGCLDIVRSVSSGTLTTSEGVEVPYMVLEWLEGSTLEAAMYARKEQKKPPMDLAEAIATLDSAALALAHAHTEGVVHRDVKPSNLFFAKTRDGVRVKVLDFGLAKIVDTESFMTPESAPTATNIFACSPAYGAPEQFAREVGPIGAWTDVYSFAFVLMELVTGERVRDADSLVEGMVKALDPSISPPVPANLKVSEAVTAVFAKAVTLTPSDRFQDVIEFWKALRAAMNGEAGPQVITASMPHDARSEAIRRVSALANMAVSSRGGTLMMKDVSGDRARAMAAVKAAQFKQNTLPIGAKSPAAPTSRASPASPAFAATVNAAPGQLASILPVQVNVNPNVSTATSPYGSRPSTPVPQRFPEPPRMTPVPPPITRGPPIAMLVIVVLVFGVIAAIGAYALITALRR